MAPVKKKPALKAKKPFKAKAKKIVAKKPVVKAAAKKPAAKPPIKTKAPVKLAAKPAANPIVKKPAPKPKKPAPKPAPAKAPAAVPVTAPAPASVETPVVQVQAPVAPAPVASTKMDEAAVRAAVLIAIQRLEPDHPGINTDTTFEQLGVVAEARAKYLVEIVGNIGVAGLPQFSAPDLSTFYTVGQVIQAVWEAYQKIG